MELKTTHQVSDVFNNNIFNQGNSLREWLTEETMWVDI